MNDLFQSLYQHLNVEPDHRGEVHCACPACGKEPKRGQVHFSFSERGGHCFCCGLNISLQALAAHYSIEDDERIAPVERVEKPKREAPRLDFDRLAVEYSLARGVVEKWNRYKALPVNVIDKNVLGYGRLPRYSSKCQHDRLIVPIFGPDNMCIGLRARSVGCKCGKWLSPAGSEMFLYNWQTLRDAQGQLLFIVENPIDALLLELAHDNIKAVATLGVTIWDDEYTPLVVECGAKRIIIAYDADRPGNGGGVTGREAWLSSHNKLIEPNGVKLTNRLLEAGAPAMLFPWPEDTPIHTDIGDVIESLGRVA